MDVSLLLSLTDRVPALAVPSAMHPDAWPLGERLAAWSRSRGLVLGDPDTSWLGRARCERLAARVLPTADPDRVDLFARWLTWTFALDDMIDEASLAGSATAVHALYQDLLRALRRGHARPGARPVESTLVELWQATSDGMGRDWRRRFLLHMEEHRAGCAEEAVNRRTGHTPTAAEYPALRRRACGPYLYDLAEPILGVELPGRIMITPAWKVMSEGTADVIAWTNDVASYAREAARSESHNHVAVLATTYGIGPHQAAAMVVDRIAERVEEVRTAARSLPSFLNRMRFTPYERAITKQVVKVLLDTPRAHLDWVIESGRYNATDDTPTLLPTQRTNRLDALASLRPHP
ncbi:terpene synthase family protein [Spirillospora sp. CA-294931]|uniref:terpene synthase family protein n=1 Tax=Spirillospora sp. CA-294931 TaxID=3240042 RepID=UPI003D8AD925